MAVSNDVDDSLGDVCIYVRALDTSLGAGVAGRSSMISVLSDPVVAKP